MSYDNTCKYLAEHYPAAYVWWLLGIESQHIEIIKTELSQEPIHADSLTFLGVADQILHIEFQTSTISKPPIPFRMLDYSVRLKREHHCRVKQFVIFLQETSDPIAYTHVYEDDSTIHHYNVIRLWEQDPAIFLDNPGLLPLAPLTRSESPAGLLARVAERIDRIEDRKRKRDLVGCTEILAGLRFEKNFIYHFLREDIMRESTVYQDIVQRSKRETLISVVMRFLRVRFGELDSPILDRVQALSVEQLEALMEPLFNISEMSDLMLWLNQHS